MVETTYWWNCHESCFWSRIEHQPFEEERK